MGSMCSQTILIVEDEPLNRLWIRYYLEQAGYHVLDAKDGREAIDHCAREPEITLILSDLCMGAENGVEIAQQVEKLKPGIKTLFMSAHDDDWVREHAPDDAELQIIHKPFAPHDLLAYVRAYLDNRPQSEHKN